MRLSTLLKWDLVFLFKYGIALASLIVALVWIAIIAFLPASTMRYVIPIAFVTDFAVSGFLYMGAMLFMDKDQGTLSAQMITPIKVREYILSKVIILSGLITLLAGAISFGVYFAHDIVLHPMGIIVVSFLASSFFVLFGLIVSIHCKSFTDMILPMGLVMAVLFLPFLIYVRSDWPFLVTLFFSVLPTYSMLTLIEALFIPQPIVELLISLTYVLTLSGFIFKVSIRLFNQRIIGRREDIDG